MRYLVLACTLLLAPRAAKAQVLGDTLRQTVADHFQLDDFSVQDLVQHAGVEGDRAVAVTLEGQPYALELSPHSLRSADFEVWFADDEGLHRWENVPAPMTYRGDLRSLVTGEVEGRVRATLRDGSVEAMIRRFDQRDFEVHPLRHLDPYAPARRHVVFWANPSQAPTGTCGVSEEQVDRADRPRILPPPAPVQARTRSAQTTVTDIAIEVDWRSFLFTNADLTDTLVDLENVMNAVEDIYEADLNITYEITLVVVRTTAASDPYSTNNSATLLNQFGGQWFNNFRQVNRDIAHLMTGRNLVGSIIGIANLAAVCNNSNGFALSQTHFSSWFTGRVGLTAHELGHNWNSGHCNGQLDCSIMCSGLGGCTGVLTDFGAGAEQTIENFANFVSCTRDIDPAPPLPIWDDFESGEFQAGLYSLVYRAIISPNGTNEPSGTEAMKVNSTGAGVYQDDEVRTNQFDLSAASDVYVSFFSQHRNVEAGETLQIDYNDDQGFWQPLLTLTSDGNTQSEFEFQRVAVPGDGYHEEFQLRIKPDGNEGNDAWFLDDLSIAEGGLALTVEPLVAGQTSELRTYGAQSGEQVYFLYGLFGTGAGPCFFGGVFCIDLLGTLYILDAPLADGAGEATAQFIVPAGFPAIGVATQAVVVRGSGGVDSVKTNPVEQVVQP